MDKIQSKFYALPLPVQAGVLIGASVILFGIVGPSMISSNSTIAVWVGIGLLLGSTYGMWTLSSKLRGLLK